MGEIRDTGMDPYDSLVCYVAAKKRQVSQIEVFDFFEDKKVRKHFKG